MSNNNDEPPAIRELFCKWNIPDAITNNFIVNGITLLLLKTLSADLLKELCPHVATRIHLKQQIDGLVVSNLNNNDEVGNAGNNDIQIDGEDVLDSAEAEADDEVDCFPFLNLINLIKLSPEGTTILADYEKNGKLNSSNQQLVVDIIGRFLYPWQKKNVIQNCHYRCLLNKIKKSFPNESLGVYFIKPDSKRLSATNKPLPMRGKLPDKIRNLKYTSGINRSKKRQNNAVDVSMEEKRQRYDQLLAENIDDINWLKNNYNPWETVEAKWNSTFEIRNCSTHESVSKFINEWPILNDLRGKNLICLHFESMYPNKSNLLRSSWMTFFDRIKTLRSSKYTEDKIIQTYKELIATLENEEETNHLKFVIELLMLPYLVPPKGRNSKKIKHTKKEASETIVLFVENPGDIHTEMGKQRLRAHNKKDTVQPYIIIQGNMLEHNQVLLVVDDIKYQFTSSITAFDCLFKCFHVFQGQYPKDSKHIYLLIQRCVYNVKTPYNVLPTTIDMIEAIERL